MTYSIRPKKKTYSDIELHNFAEAHKNRKATYFEIAKEGERQALGVPAQIHKKGSAVEYKGNLAIVKETTNKGVYLQPLSEKGEVLSDDKDLPKPIFIKEKDYEKNASPTGATVPFVLGNMITLGYIPKR